MSIAREPDLYGTITIGASCATCTGGQTNLGSDNETYGAGPDLSGPVEIAFIYNSNSTANGPFGYGRTLDVNLYLQASPERVVLTRGNGTRAEYQIEDADGTATNLSYVAQKLGTRNTLTRDDAQNLWLETAPDGRVTAYSTGVGIEVCRALWVEDSVGNRHTFSYDPQSKLLVAVADAYGRQTQLFYNSDNLLERVKDFAGRDTLFTYATGASGQSVLTQVTGPTGCHTAYQYNARLLLNAVIDPNGFRTEYNYDDQNRVISRTIVGVGTSHYAYPSEGAIFTNELGESTTFLVNGQQKLVGAVNDKGQERALVRDANGRETARQNMTGATSHTVYNSRGEVVSFTDALEHTTTYQRDAWGNTTRLDHPDGSFELMEWGAGDVAARRRLLKHTDQLGGQTTYTYDSHGKVLSVKDALNAVTTMGYDGFGRLIRLTDALGQTTGKATTFEYDGADNLTARVNELNHRWTYQYDLADRVVKSTDAESGVMEFGYDSNGNVTLQIDELKQPTRTSYNAFDLLIEQTDALQNVTRWEYDALGRQIAQVATVNGIEQRSSIEINNLGQISATIDALGRRTETEFDSDNRPIATRNALNGRIVRSYNALSQVTAIVDALGHRTEIQYDERGRQTIVTNVLTGAANTETETVYDAKGQVIATIDELGQRTTMEYDKVGRMTAVVDANANANNQGASHRTLMEYDAIGQQIAQVDALGNRTEMEYDAAGRHIATIEAVGVLNYRTEMAYDKVGRLVMTTQANNSVTRAEYDAKGQQIADVDARIRRTVVEYDALGRQTAIIDARKNRTEMTYDAIGQLLSRRDALNNVERFTYDKVGNQITRLDGRKQLTVYVYDALNRLVSEQLTGEAAITFTYDAMGQQLTMTDASGTTTNTYDALGRVLSETNGRGNRLAYEYDVAGRRTAMVDPENGRTLYAYDGNGWLTKLTDPQNGVTNYSYDKLGRELTKTLPNGVTSSHVYNAVGDETLLEERDVSGTLLNSYVSTYNKVGMKLSVTEKDGSIVSYRYYPDNSLSREERVGSSPYVREYFYDAAGNLLRRVRDGFENAAVLDKANQIVSKTGPSGTVNFFYDADGNLSRQSNPDGSGTSYFFDGRDQLSAVEIKSAGGALSHRSEFLYDGFGRLVKSREFVRQNSAWVKQSERGRVFDGMDTIQERGAANQVLGHLTRDGNIGGVLSRKTSSGTTFFGYDGNGNVTTLSDAQGNRVGSYRYDGFGNALEVSGAAANQNSHRFSTKELHAPSGLYYYGFRFYSPVLSRWISRDPIREMGGVNLYQMLDNNAINIIDNYGLKKNVVLQGIDVVVRKTIMGYNTPFNKTIKGSAVFSLEDTWGGNILLIGGSKADKARVKKEFATILTTHLGQKLLRRIQADKKPILVHIGNFKKPAGETKHMISGTTDDGCTANYDDPAGKGRGNEIWINLKYNKPVNTLTGPQILPVDVQIVHELGHAVLGVSDFDSDDFMANVNATENPYREERRRQLLKMGVPLTTFNLYSSRKSYGQ